jgi:hypothetical protein
MEQHNADADINMFGIRICSTKNNMLENHTRPDAYRITRNNWHPSWNNNYIYLGVTQ